MKHLIYFFFLLMAVCEIQAQTQIANSRSANATANHNQRKIVRDALDNVYVVFADSSEQGNVIKGLWFNRKTSNWSEAVKIEDGTNPTISISKKGQFHIVFESNDSLREIRHTSSTDFQKWKSAISISDKDFDNRLPVSDTDSTGKLNVFWIKKLENQNEALVYAYVKNDTLSFKKQVFVKETINDIAIANHLQNHNDVLVFAMQFQTDSILFFLSKDALNSIDTIYKTTGTQPCITFNSVTPHYENHNPIRLLYINNSKQLTELEYNYKIRYDYQIFGKILSTEPTDFVCINNVMPPIGYSFLFIQNGNLYHTFSFGARFSNITILDSILTEPINPSIAYKNFNLIHVDYIWMQKNGAAFDIFHKRDHKLINIGGSDVETDKGFLLTGYPNPFSTLHFIDVLVENGDHVPLIEIYNATARRIDILKENNIVGKKYSYIWNPKGKNLSTGLYLVKCKVGQAVVVRKVLYVD